MPDKSLNEAECLALMQSAATLLAAHLQNSQLSALGLKQPGMADATGRAYGWFEEIYDRLAEVYVSKRDHG